MRRNRGGITGSRKKPDGGTRPPAPAAIPLLPAPEYLAPHPAVACLGQALEAVVPLPLVTKGGALAVVAGEVPVPAVELTLFGRRVNCRRGGGCRGRRRTRRSGPITAVSVDFTIVAPRRPVNTARTAHNSIRAGVTVSEVERVPYLVSRRPGSPRPLRVPGRGKIYARVPLKKTHSRVTPAEIISDRTHAGIAMPGKPADDDGMRGRVLIRRRSSVESDE